jgi:hypothetical protein
MSYLFPEGSGAELGVLQVGANINVANSIISIPQSVASNANITFNTINADGNLNVAGIIESIGSITTASDVSAAAVYDNQNRVITHITPTANTGIAITGVTSNGPNAAFTVTNTGVTSLVAGNNISISAATGNITITATGSGIVTTVGVSNNYTALSTDEYIGATANSITITLPPGVTGKSYTIKNEGAGGSVSVSATGPEKIDGSPNKSLNNNASLTAIFRAGVWRVI